MVYTRTSLVRHINVENVTKEGCKLKHAWQMLICLPMEITHILLAGGVLELHRTGKFAKFSIDWLVTLSNYF